jgi:subtilase family serine protease
MLGAASVSLAVVTTGTTGVANASQAQPATASSQASHPSSAQAACPPASPGHVRCFAFTRPGAIQHPGGAAAAQGLPVGYGPADLQSAYNLPSGGGGGQVIAIADAFDDPNAEADLAVYRQTYGLPPCTTANGCFSKVNQQGVAGNYPPADRSGGWETEESLDLDMVSAACPACHIILVEANDNSIANLAAAEDTAASFSPTAISNSYGTNEFAGMDAFASSYDHPGVAVTVSSGDAGFGPAQFPAVLSSVIAVGGTSLLHRAKGSRGWTETAWSGSGSGCSAYVAKPAWQQDRLCSMRTTADVSAVADPNTGVAVYDSTSYQGYVGWLVFGGTSVASPLVASVYALAGNASSVTAASSLYSHTGSLFDVTSGSNGSCGGSYLCTAKSGYDGPTGLGTPNGTAAF